MRPTFLSKSSWSFCYSYVCHHFCGTALSIPISLRMNATHDLRFRLEEAKMGGGFGSKLQAISQPQTVRYERQPQAYLFNCTPAQSVVHSVLAAKESAITCFNSACASALFESVI